MKITASVRNGNNFNDVKVSTASEEKQLSMPSKAGGYGSMVNGGELLFLALATCCCNDLYREAGKRNIKLEEVTVNVTGLFGGEGDPASEITYSVRVSAPGHSEEEVQELIRFTDKVAEIQNTLRKGVNVKLID